MCSSREEISKKLRKRMERKRKMNNEETTVNSHKLRIAQTHTESNGMQLPLGFSSPSWRTRESSHQSSWRWPNTKPPCYQRGLRGPGNQSDLQSNDQKKESVWTSLMLYHLQLPENRNGLSKSQTIANDPNSELRLRSPSLSRGGVGGAQQRSTHSIGTCRSSGSWARPRLTPLPG